MIASEHLSLLSVSPDGIQKLRELILVLAIRGKLVPQDADDEPASELLARLTQQRAKLEADGTCKKSKATPPVDASEQPFELPATWRWCRFPEIADYRMGKTPPTKESAYWSTDGTPWVSISDMVHGETVLTTSRTVSNTAREKVFKAPPAPAGTLLMSFKLTLGKVATLGVDAFHNEAIISIFPFAGVSQEFLRHFLPMIAKRGNSKNALMGDTLNSESLSLLAIPLPPLAEQHRIVAKVDELMTNCDLLEAEQADAAAAHMRLVHTLLGTLTQSTHAADLAANWQRLEAHFDILFTTESSLDALKQTILQLAVTGKLVRQDPNDESASELLKRISSARKIKRKISNIDTDSLEVPLPSLPVNWQWTVVDQIASDMANSITDGPFGANLKTEHYISTPGRRVIRLQNIGKREFRAEHHAYIDAERFALLEKHRVLPGDLVVAGLVDDGVRCCKLPPDIGNAVVKADCYRFSVHECLSPDFALDYLNSPLASLFAASHHHGMTLTRIGLGNFRQLPFPLPPAAEQRRIVTKVNELMALCDQLKATIAESNCGQERLASALIESALKAA